jgi:N6-L-threonylcarbamoyladenine synthase
MLILGIESSCDETAAALVEIQNGVFEVKSNVVSSQVKIHAKYGGVIPEVAARKHLEMMIPAIKKALGRVSSDKIGAIAVTAGPGLITSLLVGVETARGLAFAWKKPLIAVNHLDGHICANLLSQVGKSEIRNPKSETNSKFKILNSKFPALALIVSGGHTELVLMKGFGKYQIVGETLDDAVGECFDKAAKIIGLGYPGGPAVAREAEKFEARNQKSKTNSKFQIPNSKFSLPRPMLNSPDFNFSFSGLKTAVLYLVKSLTEAERKKLTPAICAEFQNAAVEVLVKKTVAAAKKHNVKNVFLAGGVAANRHLRESLKWAVHDNLIGVGYFVPEFKFTGDNAAMIAAAGYFKYIKKFFADLEKLDANPNWRIDEQLSNCRIVKLF